jgi:5-hydroxyisourate hydrolase
MAGITTHVLDTAKGRPAANVRVTLVRDGQTLFEGATDNDGRARLLERAEPGTYRLTFAVGEYNPGGFFPEATIVFRVDEPAQPHYHVPLLLSPFGYATYRGS